ncbi:MAG TPA: FtsX-like permease family protein [Candidatus Saccharimonadales bacterium]|nr:FtsX-like permease family protein [Candidatus Saccharimonadales bacterium]
MTDALGTERLNLPPNGHTEALQASVLQELEREYAQEGRRQAMVGTGMVAGAVGASLAIWELSRQGAGRITASLPFNENIQQIVNGVDDALAPAGAVVLPTAIAIVGGVKLAGAWNSRARFIDRYSSREPNDEGAGLRGRVANFLRRIPVVATAGVALGAFTAGIGTEVSEGPQRPIGELNKLVPGHSMVVQYKDVMPMVQSNVNHHLVERVRSKAAERGVRTHIFDFNLGAYEYKGHGRTDLIAGIETDSSSPIHWTLEQGCTDIPIIMDTSSGIKVNSRFSMNGVSVQAVGEMNDGSAINRIGGIMDVHALQSCLEQQSDGQGAVHAVVLETDTTTTQEIVHEANQGINAPQAVITKEQYRENNRKFWEANVQPITNVLSLASGAVALIAMSGTMLSRLLRNRRELAAKMAAGFSTTQLRATELVRSAKDGIAAALLGTAIATGITPAANTLESGFKAGIGLREACIAFALGIGGTVIGGAGRLLRLRKTINPSENTRV